VFASFNGGRVRVLKNLGDTKREDEAGLRKNPGETEIPGGGKKKKLLDNYGSFLSDRVEGIKKCIPSEEE